jgi:hypothetical protein
MYLLFTDVLLVPDHIVTLSSETSQSHKQTVVNLLAAETLMYGTLYLPPCVLHRPFRHLNVAQNNSISPTVLKGRDIVLPVRANSGSVHLYDVVAWCITRTRNIHFAAHTTVAAPNGYYS